MFVSVDADELNGSLVALEVEQRALDLRRVQLMAVWDRRQAWANDGSATPAARMARDAGLSGQQARERVKVARLLVSSMPATAASFGDLGWSKARLLANVIDERTKAAFAAQEEELVEHARRLSVDQLAVVLGHWRRMVDVDGANRDADAMHAEQYVQLPVSWNGEGFLKGRLDPEATAVVKSALDAIAEELYRSEKRDHTLAELRGEEPEPRTLDSHRYALALREMAERAMATTAAVAGDTPTAPARPSVLVTIDADAEGALRARFASGAPFDLADATRLACDAAVARVITKNGVVPLSLGRTVRDPSEAQRRAMSAVWSMCAFPGCDRPFAWCDLHHVLHWDHGGPTNIDWLLPLCKAHHTKHHKSVFTIGRRPDGTFWFDRANGTPIGNANPTLNQLGWRLLHLDRTRLTAA